MTSTAPSTISTVPAPGIYELDPSHSSVSFSARHLMVSKVRGSFAVTGGTIVVGENPADSSVEAVIDATSVYSGDSNRDEHLRSDDFFATASFPTIEFRSFQVENNDDGEFTLAGDLTVRGVTRPVVLEGEYLGTQETPFGDTRIGFTAETEVSRKEWGLEWNMAIEAGGVVVGDKVKLAIDVEAIRQQPAQQ
jgi:polyisoprenoid-binding protein YceI